MTRHAPTTSLTVVADLKDNSALKSSQTILFDHSCEDGHIVDHNDNLVGPFSGSNPVLMERWLDPQGEPAPWVPIKGVLNLPRHIVAHPRFQSAAKLRNSGSSVHSRNDTKSNTTGSRSARYGMTYTESVITGVSFDYSALFS